MRLLVIPTTLLLMTMLAVAPAAAIAVDLPRLPGEPMSGPNSEDRSYPLEETTYDVPPDHTNLIVSADDVVFGSSVPLSVCWTAPDGDDTCGEGDVYAEGCGSLAALGAPFSGGKAVAYGPTPTVHDDLTVCFATAGTITFSSW